MGLRKSIVQNQDSIGYYHNNAKKIIFSTGGHDLVKDIQILLCSSLHIQTELPHPNH